MQLAPVEERMVVSEMGEQLSPKMEPASVAAREGMMSVGAIACATGATMGRRIPKVPQEAPVEKLRKPARMKIMAGRMFIRPPAPFIAAETKSMEYRP